MFRCIVDHSALTNEEEYLICNTCNRKYPILELHGHKGIPDMRIQHEKLEYELKFRIPANIYDEIDLVNFGEASFANFKGPSRKQIRKKYKTKLQKEIIYYTDKILDELGREIIILDIGTGKGGNKRLLYEKGFKNIIACEFTDTGRANVLLDVHRLPFADNSIDMIISTSTLEHFYNPFIALKEISRVLKPNGRLIASGSFWESWHSSSNFHFTPGGMIHLCESAGLKVVDMWSGWGFIPSVGSHAMGLMKCKALLYSAQKMFDKIQKFKRGKQDAFIHKLKTSGSIGIYAVKRKS